MKAKTIQNALGTKRMKIHKVSPKYIGVLVTKVVKCIIVCIHIYTLRYICIEISCRQSHLAEKKFLLLVAPSLPPGSWRRNQNSGIEIQESENMK